MRTRVPWAACLFLLACSRPQATVMPVGPHGVARPEGCGLALVAERELSFPHQDIARVQVRCEHRNACLDELRRQACDAGADTVYALEIDPSDTRVAAVVAARMAPPPMPMPAPQPMPPPPPPSAPATSACSPPCSPGYTCVDGSCVAVCNPPCSPGFVCAQDRTCRPEPTPDAGAPSF